MSRPIHSWRLSAVLAAAALLVSAPLARSQGACFNPDQLNGMCCQPLQANLPLFPGIAMQSLGIYWTNCAPTVQNLTGVQWAPPVMTTCSEYTTTLNVINMANGAVLLSGKMVLNYTRTWAEVDPAGIQWQVWRFVAKADLAAPTAGALVPIAPQPNCIAPFGPHPTSFFYGYVDYALPCGGNQFSSALVLHHAGDFLIHQPGLSDKPGAFHPNRSCGIVAPHTAVNPFVPANLPAPVGPLIGEAVRNVVSPFVPGLCSAEDPISGGAIAPLGRACFCPLMAAPQQHTLRVMTGKGTCVDPLGLNSSFASQMINFPTVPWPHVVTTSFGFWSTAASYPGPEVAWVDEGLFIDHDACTVTDWVDIDYGGTTQRGWQVIGPAPISPSFEYTDLGDNYSAPLFGPYPLPAVGSIRPTDRLIYVNTP